MRNVPRSLLLITIDCFRADHAGFLGYAIPTTPFLDSLARESFVFKNAIASGVPTYYSLPALLASRYPLSLGRDVVGIAPGENTIATELQACGFRTAAFAAANPYVSAEFGYDQGFETFSDFLSGTGVNFATEGRPSGTGFRSSANRLLSQACHRVPLAGAAYDEAYFRYCQKISTSAQETLEDLRKFPAADGVVDRAIAWLEQDSTRPFFLWLHLMDPHGPYYPRAQALEAMRQGGCSAAEARYANSYWARGDLGAERLRKQRERITELYDAGIWWADQQIRRLAERLSELKYWEQCAVAVTADHGEEFLDHGGRFHTPLHLYEELVHVPLLLRVPGMSERSHVDAPFGLIDLAPTLLDVLDMPPPASFRGRSWWRDLKNGRSPVRPVFTESVYGCSNPLDREKRFAPRLLSARKGSYKLIVNFASGMDELFDLHADPKELSPVPLAAANGVRKELLEMAKQHIEKSRKSSDYDLRLSAQARELRVRWERESGNRPN